MIREIAPQHLADVPLFKNLSHAELQPLLSTCEIREYPAGTLILKAGESNQALYVVLEGEAEVRFVTLVPEGESVGTLPPKSVFGEASFFHPAPHHANIVALQPTTVVRLSRESYDKLVASGDRAASKLAANAAAILAGRLHATDEWVVTMLREREDATIAQNWAKFRSRMGSSIEFQTGFVGVRGA